MHAIGSAILISVLTSIPYHIPFVVFLLFDIVLIVQSFFIQIFFSRSKIGIIFALVFFILQYSMNFLIINVKGPSMSIHQVVSMVPHVAFLLAFKEVAFAHSHDIPLDFNKEVNSYTIETAVISFICNIVFWGIIFIYLDQVVPNEWGAKKNPCFCFMNSDDENKR